MKPANPGVDFIVLVLILATLVVSVQSFKFALKSPFKGDKSRLTTTQPLELQLQQEMPCDICSLTSRRLEVKYDQEKLCRICAVVAHPYPAAFCAGYSGSDNDYVAFMAQALGRAGVCTARFYFRSLGVLSQGGDIQDYVEVMHLVKRKLGCMRGFINAGYSYGAAIAHGAMSVAQKTNKVLGYVGLAPPWSVNFFGDHYETQWTMSKDIHVPRIFIFGDQDTWCSKEQRDHYAKMFVSPSAKFISLPGGDHFNPVTRETSQYLMLAIKTGARTVLSFHGMK